MDHPIPPSQADVIGQLNRILQVPVFSNSNILSGFLRFIVDNTLAGKSQSLKEYTIGVAVLSKKEGYDPQTDGAVRIHAGRLRRALYDYYNGPGNLDPIYISVPKGSYIPKFESVTPVDVKPEAKQVVVQYKPTLAVVPFHVHESALQPLADGLCDQICTEFTNFNELSVVSYYTSRKIALQKTDLKETALLLDCNHLLTGSIQSIDTRLRIRVQLIRTDTQHQIWASTYEKEKSAINTFHIQDDIVRHVVNQIAGSHGIIFRDAARVLPGKNMLNLKVYDAIFWYYHMVNNQNESVFNKALASMKDAVQLDPHYSLGWAVLSETYVSGVFNGFDAHIANPLEEALRCGQEAIKLDLRCHHAYQSLALAYLFQHKKTDCLKIIEQWIGLKSNAAGISGGLGFCLICCGEYERGYKMLLDSIQLNPYYPWWFNGGLGFYHAKKKEWEDVVYWAEKMHLHCDPWELILKITSLREMGNEAEASAHAKQLHDNFPHITKNTGQYIGAFIQDPILVERLIKAIEK